MAQPRPRGGPSLVLLVVSILLILFGFYTLNVALSFGLDSSLGLLYFLAAVFSFGLVAFSVMRVRRGIGLANPAAGKVLSIVKCPQCSFKQIKNFAFGDYVTKTLGTCTQCNTATLFIDGIYGESAARR